MIVVFVSDKFFFFGSLGCNRRIGRVEIRRFRSIGRGGSYVKVIRLLWFDGLTGINVK